jgi:hypothetical protein
MKIQKYIDLEGLNEEVIALAKTISENYEIWQYE